MKQTSALQGFTLIELLVVIAIIGMLMGLISFSIRSAFSTAKGAACVNNLRQIYLGIQMYAEDHDGCWLPHPIGEGAGPTYGSTICLWNGITTYGMGVLYSSYLDDLDVFWCSLNKQCIGTKSNFEVAGKFCNSNYIAFTYSAAGSGKLSLQSGKVLVSDYSVIGGAMAPVSDYGPHKLKYNAILTDGSVVLIKAYAGAEIYY